MRDSIGAFANLQDVTGGTVETDLCHANLVVVEVVDQVGRANERVAEQDGAVATGYNAKDASLLSIFECRGSSIRVEDGNDHFAHGDSDYGLAEGENEHVRTVCQGTVDIGTADRVIINGRYLAIYAGNDSIGKIGQGGARVDEDRQCLITCDTFIAQRQCSQGDKELQVRPVHLLDRKGSQGAFESLTVDTTKEDASRPCFQVVDKERVGIRVDMSRSYESRRQVLVCLASISLHLRLERRVANAKHTHAQVTLVPNAKLKARQSHIAHSKSVSGIVATRARIVDIANVEITADEFVGRRVVGRVHASRRTAGFALADW